MYSAELSKIVEIFQLKNILPELSLEGRAVKKKEVNRPALQLAGFYESFDYARLQVIGRVEHSFLLSLEEEKRKTAVRNFFSYRIPGLIICRDLEIFPEMLEYGREFDVPILQTDQITTDFIAELIYWLREELADRVMMHGVLVDIYGEGVLITGASGIGKSETALELIKRGHRLIADDAVEIKKVADRRLIGSCPEIIRYLIELRGIGIINVKELFGVGSVKDQKTIDLVIRLELWDGGSTGASYDRLGLNEEYIEILGNKVQLNTIPVRPGRNVAMICESAAMTNRQKKMGKNTAKDFADRIGK
ncbi:MAG: HPr(Ser) kinase/phosphatase [Bacillota bacterium]|nr:HPr(Ser) kinase/phosphatase [Bacillota bacterium]